jgi:hypothetical protein
LNDHNWPGADVPLLYVDFWPQANRQLLGLNVIADGGGGADYSLFLAK